VLVVEVAAARSAARLVGAGLDTWTAVLGAVLLGLAVGGELGGRLSDRRSPRRVVAGLLLAASVVVALGAWSPLLLSLAARADAVPWTLRLAGGAVLAFAPAAALLGALTPALARAVLPGAEGARGRAIGVVYAAGTAGAVLAALATAPVLCPLVGTRATLLVAAIGLVLLRPLAGARVEVPWTAGLAAFVLAAVLPLGPARALGLRLGLREDAEGVYVRESGYAHVRVEPIEEVRADGRPRRARQLTIDSFVHGMVDLDDPTWLGYGYEGIYAAVTDRLAPAGAPRERPLRAFFVGGGAYVFPRHLRRTRPDAALEVAEIDPAVTRAAREAMGLAPEPGFSIRHEDARPALERAQREGRRFDLVYGDAFNDLSVPWHLATREFARAVAACTDGAYLLNVIDEGASARFLGAVLRTLDGAFAHVEVLGLERGSRGPETFVVVASGRPLDLDGLARPDPGGAPGAVLPIVRYARSEADEFRARAGTAVLADGHAPVEWLLAPLVRARGGR
jgi:MFS family permease